MRNVEIIDEAIAENKQIAFDILCCNGRGEQAVSNRPFEFNYNTLYILYMSLRQGSIKKRSLITDKQGGSSYIVRYGTYLVHKTQKNVAKRSLLL